MIFENIMKECIMETISLRTGNVLPMEGFGVFRVKDKDECQSAVYEAIRSGC